MNDLIPSELRECEAVIEKNLKAFYEVGHALKRIRDGRLYRENYATFEDYCRDRWEFTKTYANYLVASTGVMENLTTQVVIPPSEKHVRPLTKLEPEQQKEAWQKAVETAPDGKITARHVSRVKFPPLSHWTV